MLGGILLATIPGINDKYIHLDKELTLEGEEVIDPQCLLTFEYEYPEQPTEVSIDTDELTALCPWTSLPDYGTLKITYVPSNSEIELKSLKYYLLSFRDVGIVQEHVANRILKDLVALCNPQSMNIVLDYRVRGGLHTSVSVSHNSAT